MKFASYSFLVLLCALVLATPSVFGENSVTQTVVAGENVSLGTFSVQLSSIDRSANAVVVDTYVEGKYDDTIRVEQGIDQVQGKVGIGLVSIDRSVTPSAATIELKERPLASIIDAKVEGLSLVEQENRLQIIVENTGTVEDEFVIKVDFSTTISIDDTARTVFLQAGERKSSYLRYTPLIEGRSNVIISLLSNDVIIDTQLYEITSVKETLTSIECRLATTTLTKNEIVNAQLRCTSPFLSQQTIQIDLEIGTQTESIVVGVGPKETKLVTLPIIIIDDVEEARITLYDTFGNRISTKLVEFTLEGIQRDEVVSQQVATQTQDNNGIAADQQQQNDSADETITATTSTDAVKIMLYVAGFLVLIVAILAGILVWNGVRNK